MLWQLTVTTEKLWANNNDRHRTRLEKSTKNDNVKLRKKTMTKLKPNFQINKKLECKQLLW